MKYKGLKFIKKDDGMYNINLSRIYDNNCYRKETYKHNHKHSRKR